MNAVEYENRRGVRYFLHRRVDRRGRERFVFARSLGDGAMPEVPDGYQIQESVNGTVSLVKIQARVIRELEEELVRAAVARVRSSARREGDHFVSVAMFEVEAKGETIFVHEGTGFGGVNFVGRVVMTRPSRFHPVLRFDLVDRDERAFEVRRMTWRGDGGWSYPLRRGPLRELVKDTVKHLGQDSFFNLM